MQTRHFTKAVKQETQSRLRPTGETFGRLQRGDEFKHTLPGKTQRSVVRFLCTELNDDGEVVGVRVVGPLRTARPEALRTLRPEEVVVPSQRALNAQRAAREA